MTEPLGGDPACWAHAFDGERHDLGTRRDVEALVRSFYTDAHFARRLELLTETVDEPRSAPRNSRTSRPVEPG